MNRRNLKQVAKTLTPLFALSLAVAGCPTGNESASTTSSGSKRVKTPTNETTTNPIANTINPVTASTATETATVTETKYGDDKFVDVGSETVVVKDLELANGEVLAPAEVAVAIKESQTAPENCQASKSSLVVKGDELNTVELKPNTTYSLSACEVVGEKNATVETSPVIVTKTIVTDANPPEIDSVEKEESGKIRIKILTQGNPSDTEFALFIKGIDQSGWANLVKGVLSPSDTKQWFKISLDSLDELHIKKNPDGSFSVEISFLSDGPTYSFAIIGRNIVGRETALSEPLVLPGEDDDAAVIAGGGSAEDSFDDVEVVDANSQVDVVEKKKKIKNKLHSRKNHRKKVSRELKEIARKSKKLAKQLAKAEKKLSKDKGKSENEDKKESQETLLADINRINQAAEDAEEAKMEKVKELDEVKTQVSEGKAESKELKEETKKNEKKK